MSKTPVSLLDRLREQPTPADWQRLVDLYTPLLRDWLSRYPDLRQDIDDVVQDVLRCVVRKVADFRHQGQGSFRGWLRVIAGHCNNSYWRKRRRQHPAVGGDEAALLLAQVADGDCPLDRAIDAEYNLYVLRRLMQLIEPEFRPATWRAFRRHVLDGLPPAAVANELGISEGAVLITRSRIIKRLREEARGLLDEGLID